MDDDIISPPQKVTFLSVLTTANFIFDTFDFFLELIPPSGAAPGAVNGPL